ncbi:MAG: PQQ-dependent sugar dehydrogenase [Verrucomicrobiales bacterium]
MALPGAFAEEDFPVIKLTVVDALRQAVQREASVSGLEFSDDGSDRDFIFTKSGKILAVNPANVNEAPVTFLDISDRVTAGHEGGLLGLAFAPDFADTGVFYLNYSPDYIKIPDVGSRVSRFQTGAEGLGDPASEEILLDVPIGEFRSREAENRGGHIAFGPNGYFYISAGDAEVPPDAGHPSQDLLQLSGKMLRIDVTAAPDPGRAYAIPVDNPFVGREDALPEIWALGLRNARKFSFDRLTGDLFIADVADNAREEINFQPASSTGGENYGWPYREGNEPFLREAPHDLEFTEPIATYGRSVGRSVTGGFVYRGQAFPALQGAYIAGDAVSGNFFIVRPIGEANG